MRFSDVISRVKISATNIKNFDYCITKICSDSEKVGYGDVFVCKKGTNADGHDYIGRAYERGARTFVVQRLTDELIKRDYIRYITVPDTRIAEAVMSYDFFGRPADGMTLIGITGTNGKTSTSYMLRHILCGAGLKCGLIGTVKSFALNTDITPAGVSEFNSMTTPAPEELYKTLDKMRKMGVDTVVMEASSHALDQKRLDALHFKLGVFTNLSEDHLDYHKTFSEYRNAKAHLFDLCENALINADSPDGRTILQTIGCSKYTFSANVSSRHADYIARAIVLDEAEVTYELKHNNDSCDISCPIPGEFTVYNSLAATAAANILGISLKSASVYIGSMENVPGRLERMELKNGAVLFIDYAHTPDALKKVLNTLNPIKRGRLITVFGCGGDREHEKRPLMGEIATALSDITIVTSDNCRGEKPGDIIKDILTGVNTSSDCRVIENRADAIRKALSISEKGDIILLAGKGHEDYEISNGQKKPFSEKKIVEEYFGENR